MVDTTTSKYSNSYICDFHSNYSQQLININNNLKKKNKETFKKQKLINHPKMYAEFLKHFTSIVFLLKLKRK